MTELLNYNDSVHDIVNDDGDVLPYEEPAPVVDYLPQDRWIEDQADSELEPILAVSLADRALALRDIMAYYNKRNMTRGSLQQLAIPDSGFRRRYESPETVQHGAERNTNKLLEGFHRGIATLTAVDAMQGAGVHDSEVDQLYRSVQSELNAQFLDGNADATKRHKAVQRAQKVARRTQK